MSWDEERPLHGILLLTNEKLVCTCGEELKISPAERDMTKYHRHDRLLDRHAAHKKAKEKKP